jgi:hypothetical protein
MGGGWIVSKVQSYCLEEEEGAVSIAVDAFSWKIPMGDSRIFLEGFLT